MAIQSLFIANRGEIAVRIIKAAKALGIRTIQAASEADTESLACKLADEVVVIGPPAGGKILSRRRCRDCRHQDERCRRCSSGLRLPVGKSALCRGDRGPPASPLLALTP